MNLKLETKIKIPEVGDTIYIDGELYLSHGEDDILGGKVTVSKVEFKYGSLMIITHQYPNTYYNWSHLGPKQESLKEEYKDQWSRPIPDLREKFNRWD